MFQTALRSALALALVASALGCPAEEPPVVDEPVLSVAAGAPISAVAGDAVVLEAEVSPEADSVSWTQLEGPEVTLVANDEDAVFTAPEVPESALLVFQVDATWGTEVRSDTAAVFVEGTTVGTSAPVVDAGEDQAVAGGASVDLAGVVTDADDDVSSTTWIQLSGPAVTVGNPGALATSFTAPVFSTDTQLVFQLTAEDAVGNVATDTVLIDVVANNAAPTVSAGTDQTVEEGGVVNLSGEVSDADDNLETFVWEQVTGPSVTLSDDSSLTPSFTAPDVDDDADILLRLHATDDLGVSAEAYVVVTVTALRLPPTVDVGEDLTVNSGDLVTLSAVATDPDGSIATHDWAQVLGSPVALTGDDTAEATFDAPAVLAAETLFFEYTATDNDGLSAKGLLIVTVNPPVGINGLPIVNAGADLIAPATSNVTLSGTADDLDGTIDTVAWTQVAGPTVTLLAGDTLEPSFVVPNTACADRVVFELRAVDDLGGVGVDRVAVSIYAEGQEVVDQPFYTDLESDNGGFTTDGVWAHGAPSTGPFGADTGVNVWGTELGAGVANNTDASLCMPGVRIGSDEQATLSFRLRSIVQANDGLSVEVLHPELGWIALDSEPAPSVTAVGLPTYPNLGLNADYVPVFAPLPQDIGEPVFVRFHFVTDGGFVSNGVYIDTVAVGLESVDHDGDGLLGIYDELTTYGTNPFEADSDADGVNDGDEIADGTGPLVPTDYVGAPMLSVGELLDFDTGGGDFIPEGSWEHGAPGAGPGVAYSGGQVWGVTLNGNYGNNNRSYLYLPTIDLTGVDDALFTFRLWTQASGNDGLMVEVLGDDGTWNDRAPVLTPFDGTSLSNPAWSNLGYRGEYVLVAVDLSDFADEAVRVRFAFRSDGGFTGSGPYIDDVLVVSDSSDPDNDGISGVLAEAALGSDPMVADTDGDGRNDGDEQTAGTDPNNPADYDGARVYTVPTDIDFEADTGDLVSQRGIWDFGTPANGPLEGHTGGSVWGTRLAGNYVNLDRAYLYLPAVDLTGATDPTFYFRVAASCSANDGATLERYVDGDWSSLTPEFPEYDGRDALGRSAWTTQPFYTLAAFSLAPFAGDTARLRFSFRADGGFAGNGVFLDDFRIHEESSDPDADGLPGIIDEFLTYGTDPELFDTDGDGVGDGDEITALTDPLDDTSF